MTEEQAKKIFEALGEKYEIVKVEHSLKEKTKINCFANENDYFTYNFFIDDIETLPQLIRMLPNKIADKAFAILKDAEILPILSKRELAAKELERLGYIKTSITNYDTVVAYYDEKKALYEYFDNDDYDKILKHEEIKNSPVYNLLLRVNKGK